MSNGARFSDRVAFVTGGTSGIGAAVAQRLQAEGASEECSFSRRGATFDVSGGKAVC